MIVNSIVRVAQISLKKRKWFFQMTGLVYVSFNFGMAKSDSRRVEMILICLDDLN